jgi:pyruvate dehydrogenase E2 component (dihydrolipoamide acetyltransferase)
VPYEFRLPDLGEGVSEGEITAWLVAVGQRVAEDDPMVELTSDKATVEIASPVDGVVETLHAAEGEMVQVGSVLITIETEEGSEASASSSSRAAAADTAAAAAAAAAAASIPGEAATRAADPVRATPGARKAAKELGVDLATLTGSGPGGAITERDVQSRAPAAAAAERREPLRGVRRRIADRLSQSHREVPKVTVVEECDFTDLAAQRGDLSFSPFIVRAIVSGLKAYPEFNASLEGEDVVFHGRYDIGLATQGAHGLVVPVVRGADGLSLIELDAEIKRLADAVRGDTIATDDLRGGTFTVTLAGKLGGYFATPLVNLGEAAILGVHRIAKRPVVREGEIVVRDVALVSCSFDHRITDGTRATSFLLHVIEELQRPPTQ